MVDASHQSWLDNAYKKQEEFANKSESYYNSSLKVIYLLLLSGNMPDFWNVTVQPQKYTLSCTAQPSAGGTISVTPAGTEFNKDSEVSIIAKSSENYKFVSWSGDINGTDSSQKITITKNMNVVANFSMKSAVGKPVRSSEYAGPISLSVNTFNTDNTVSLSIPKSGMTSLCLFDISGNKISNLKNEVLQAGISKVKISRNLPHGVYFLKLESVAGDAVQKITINK
jgi:hypothetical protein